MLYIPYHAIWNVKRWVYSATLAEDRPKNEDPADRYTAQLKRVAQEARRKRETQQAREATQLARVRDVNRTCRQAAPAIKRGKEVLVQGVLASEIGLVAPAASRRGPIIHPKAQDLELGEPHSAYGFVSSKLHDEAERVQRARAESARAYRRALLEQASSNRLLQAGSKVDATVERRLEEEVLAHKHERLEKLRDAKVRQLKAEGAKPELIALLARCPIAP